MSKNFDFSMRRLTPGEYEVTVVRTLKITVNSSYDADESDMAVKATILGNLEDFTIEAKK